MFSGFRVRVFGFSKLSCTVARSCACRFPNDVFHFFQFFRMPSVSAANHLWMKLISACGYQVTGSRHLLTGSRLVLHDVPCLSSTQLLPRPWLDYVGHRCRARDRCRGRSGRLWQAACNLQAGRILQDLSGMVKKVSFVPTCDTASRIK